MSTKSAAPGDVITLPRGGGALKGLGEKFAPDLHTGTGNFTIPLALPAGRNGFQPGLNLVYSSGYGNGPFGLGWSLSVPGVTRKTSKGVPRYDEAADTFILSGAEDLVAVDSQGGATRYRPRTEGLFARITHYRSAADDFWEVRSRDGLVSFYGTPGMAGSDPAVIADPKQRTKSFAWKLTRTVDPFGNRIDYEYERDTGTEGPHHWDQVYLKQIRYIDIEDSASGQNRFLVSVSLDYGAPSDVRPDPFSDYRAGFEIRTRKRCRQIVIRTHAEQDRLVRTCELVYLDERVTGDELPAAAVPPNRVSLLSELRVVGHDGSATERLPPIEFAYTRFEPDRRDFFPIEGHLPMRSLAEPDLELVDLFANGLPDFVEMNGVSRYWRNLGAGQFDLPREMREVPAGVHLAETGVQLIDANGDGRTDLLVTTAVSSGFYSLSADAGWDRRSFQRYRQAPSFDLEDPEVRLIDIDGDGITDAVRSGARFECFFNNPREGWTDTLRIERQALEVFPNVNFSDPRVKWADLSGDGLQDLALVYDGNVEYWPNLGRGRWGQQVHMDGSPRFPYGYDPKRILLGDVDGDGLADLVYVDRSRVLLWINRNGNGWSDPIEIDGTPSITDRDVVRLVDLLGSGVSGLLWSKGGSATGGARAFFLDFTGGLKPYLLAEMDNHMGAVTRVEYVPSTRFYQEDQKDRRTRWKTALPFPVQVVARVEVIDQISRGKLTTEYRYRHGYWDGGEREFCGFGMVEQVDTEPFERYHTPGLHDDGVVFTAVEPVHFSPPTLTRTWFHQGPVGNEFGDWEELDYGDEYWIVDPSLLERPPSVTELLKGLSRRDRRDALRTLRGSVLRTELYALDGMPREDRPYTVGESLFGVREVVPPGPDDEGRLRIFFPHLLGQRTTQWERGDDPLTRFSFTEDYDSYGLPRSQTQIACPRGWRSLDGIPGQPYLATRVRTGYAQRDDPQRYIVDRVATATSYELVNDGSQRLLTLKATPNTSSTARVIGQSVTYYDGDPFVGLPVGQIGAHGAAVRTESLILTEDLLQQAYTSADALATPETPPYLVPGSAPAWTPEYPQAFRDALAPRAGYVFNPGDAHHAAGYFATTMRRRYDFHDSGMKGRGLPTVMRDALGRDRAIAYDDFALVPVKVTDSAGLTTHAAYDYRVLQPAEVIDRNDNQITFAFTPLGLLRETWIRGKSGADEGDHARPSVRMTYDLLAFASAAPEERKPVSVRTLRQVHHDTETDVALPQRDEAIETVEYSDGFGRVLQIRTQGEQVIFGDAAFGGAVLPSDQNDTQGTAAAVAGKLPAPGETNVVVSGWQTYNNKGWVVETYEPFFAAGWEYARPVAAQTAQKVTTYYDPRGQGIRILNADGSERRVIYGIPEDLTNPEQFVPTPWEAYTYDANDNAGRTHAATSGAYMHHRNTPVSITVDALGRTVQAVERNGSGPADAYTTASAYDIRGSLLTVTDALGRVAFRHVYDLTDNPLRIESIDAGVRRMVLDVMGDVVELRSGKGSLSLKTYDVLDRPVRLWARDGAGEPLTLREQIIYGDNPESGLTPALAAARNLRGRPYRHYDEAGRLSFESYDFKGNLREKVRHVVSDHRILSVFDNASSSGWGINAFRVDWQPPAGSTLEQHAVSQLDDREYRTSSAFDALDRLKSLHYPEDVNGERRELRPRYNRAGALERVMLEGDDYVAHIAYNAKGQRTLVAYGNGISTRYAYDPVTFRLARLRSERYTAPGAYTYAPSGPPLQDFAYEYDLSGNLVRLRDRTPGSGLPNTLLGIDTLDRRFTYDPLYRMGEATGREHATAPPDPPWVDMVKSQDPTLARAYTEEYTYDPVGNLLQLRHLATGGTFARALPIVTGNNRLARLTVGQTTFEYEYDDRGNMTREATTRRFEWDHSDRLKAFRTQAGAAEPSVHAHYLYDSSGQRVKKVMRTQGGRHESLTYIEGILEHHLWVDSGLPKHNTRLHVLDGERRIAVARVGEAHSSDTGPRVQYHLGDHLGSSNVVVDDTGNWINREEHTPYGETSFGGFTSKRYRFTGQERDEESGLSYHRARYYALWVGRWTSADPIGIGDGVNVYRYASSNPLRTIDPGGTQGKEPAVSATDPHKYARAEIERALFPAGTHAGGSDHPESSTTTIDISGDLLGRLAKFATPTPAEQEGPGQNAWASGSTSAVQGLDAVSTGAKIANVGRLALTLQLTGDAEIVRMLKETVTPGIFSVTKPTEIPKSGPILKSLDQVGKGLPYLQVGLGFWSMYSAATQQSGYGTREGAVQSTFDILASASAIALPTYGTAFSGGYSLGQVADKGSEKVSTALFGIDLSPSRSLATQLHRVDMVGSYLLADPSKPLHKQTFGWKLGQWLTPTSPASPAR